MFEHLAHPLTLADLERTGREAGPTGAIRDAQFARSGSVGVKGERGYDTDGHLLLASVSTQAYQRERFGNTTAIAVEIVRPDKDQNGFAAGSPSGASAGSPDAAGSPATTKRSHPPRSHSSFVPPL